MAQTQSLRMKAPAHPGGFVRTEIIAPLGLTVTDAAQALGITRAALSTFLNEHTSLSADMAIRIAQAFGVSVRLGQARQRFRERSQLGGLGFTFASTSSSKRCGPWVFSQEMLDRGDTSSATP